MSTHLRYQDNSSKSRIHYDLISPFETYKIRRVHEFFCKLFQNNVLPRGSFFRSIHKAFKNRLEFEILDINFAGLRLRILPDQNASSLRFLRIGHHFDSSERKTIAEACRFVESPVFIDVGANIGLYSLLLATELPHLRVFAVEPHPGICKQLLYNINLNPNLSIEVLACAVSDNSGLVRIQTNFVNLGATRIEDDGDVEVNCTTLEKLISELKLDRVDAIKVDVEGYEDRVLIPYLQNAPDSLLPSVIVLEFNPNQWQNNLVSVANTRGFQQTKRSGLNCILIRK